MAEGQYCSNGDKGGGVRLVAKYFALGCAMPLLCPTAGVAQSAVATEDARTSLAREAIRLSFPAERARKDSAASFAASYRRSALASPKGAALEKQFPGIVDAGAVAAGAELERLFPIEIEPRLIDETARFVAADLSEGEWREAIAFYQSPVGRRFISLSPDNMDMKTGTVSLASLSIEDRAAIARFQQTPAGRGAARVWARFPELLASLSAKLFPPILPRIQTAALDAMRAFTREVSNR